MIGAPKDMWGIAAFRILVDQAGKAHALWILDITPSLLSRYLNGTSRVPRCAVLALYWESNWGRAVIGSHYQTEARFLHLEIGSLKRENAQLRASVAELLVTGDFGCANDSVMLR